MITSYPQAVAVARESSDRRVLVERSGSRAVVHLHDPGRLNPLSLDLTVQLHDTLRELTSDPELRCVVLTGTDPAFCAGGDFKLMRHVLHPMVDEGPGGGTSAWQWIRGQFGAIVRLITRTDTTFIAAVNGAAAGVGLAIALACDLILASDRASFVPAFGEIGLVPESGLSWQLNRRLGYQRTFEFFMGTRRLNGAEAVELGLANAVVSHAELLPAALEWCKRIDTLPAHVPAMTKNMLRAAADMSWEQAIMMEELAMPNCFTTRSHRAAVSERLGDA